LTRDAPIPILKDQVIERRELVVEVGHRSASYRDESYACDKPAGVNRSQSVWSDHVSATTRGDLRFLSLLLTGVAR
jgi:hypothetical protein